MATFRLPILTQATLPDASGNVFFEPTSVIFVNDAFRHGVWNFLDSATLDNLHGKFDVPPNYLANPRLIVVWTASAIVGNVRWRFRYRAVGGDDLESLDQAGNQEDVAVTDAAPGAAFRRLEVAIPLTAANFAAMDTVEFNINRDGTHIDENMAATAMLFGLLFEFTDV